MPWPVAAIEGNRFDLRPLVTHRGRLQEIVETYPVFGRQCDGALQVASLPGSARGCAPRSQSSARHS